MIGRLLLLAVVAAALFGAYELRQQLWQPLPLSTPVVAEVAKGAGFNQVLRDWQQRGWLASNRQRWALSLYARVTGQDQAIKAGEYELRPGLRAIDLPALLVSGKVLLHELTVVEGWTFEQLMLALAQHPALAQGETALSASDVMAALERPGLHPEGRFYPDTYHFPRGTTLLAFLRRAFQRMEDVLAAEWAQRAGGLPYAGPDEALIMASIVERETSVAAERFDIAGVFVRRLEKGMRLQTDPTVIYGMGAAYQGNIRKRDLETDTPYNTYTRKGLPPTPICLPGRAALNAALHPAAGTALYFVSKGDGSHHFSATIEEHNAAVARYQLRRRPR